MQRDDEAPGPAREHEEPTAAEQVGEAAGGISGVVAGASLGAIAGPIGAVLGGLAGAVGGWWAGRAIVEMAERFGEADDDHYRHHYETAGGAYADRSYQQVRPAYQLGHLAGVNPEYTGRDFEEIEPDLQRGWESSVEGPTAGWHQVRGYAREAYSRARERGAAGMASAARGSFPDRETELPDGVSGFADHAPGLGEREHDLADRQTGAAGGRNASAPAPGIGSTDGAAARLGGTTERASFNDPIPDSDVIHHGTEAHTAPADHTASEGTPQWMRQPSDQGGFGAHIGGGTSERSDDAAPGEERQHTEAPIGEEERQRAEAARRARELGAAGGTTAGGPTSGPAPGGPYSEGPGASSDPTDRRS